MARPSKTDGLKRSASTSIASPSPKAATSPAPRMLTPSEIASLRQDKKATIERARALGRRRERA